MLDIKVRILEGLILHTILDSFRTFFWHFHTPKTLKLQTFRGFLSLLIPHACPACLKYALIDLIQQYKYWKLKKVW